MLVRGVLCLFVVVVIGCGSPTDPTEAPVPESASPPSTVLRIASLAGEPVNSGTVTVGGEPYTINAGAVTLPASVDSAAEVRIAVPGFQERWTLYRGSGLFTLLPFQDGVDGEYYRTLVFGQYTPGVIQSVRKDAVRVSVAPGFPWTDILQDSLATVTSVSGISFELISEGAGDVVVEYDASLWQRGVGIGAAELAYSAPNVIVGGRILVDPEGYDLKGILDHEFGHILGLGHSPRERDRMYYRLTRGGSFAAVEGSAIHFLRQRFPGTQPLDDDRALGVNVGTAGGKFYGKIIGCR